MRMIQGKKAAGPYLPLAVGLLAFSTLLFEVLLTRIFSVTLWYHFGFAVISLAMFGTCAGAMLSSRFQGRLPLTAALFAVFSFASVVFHLESPLPDFSQLISFCLLILSQLSLFFLAFFFAGVGLGIVFTQYTHQIGRIYFFDLLGAALGSLAIVPLLYQFDGTSLVFFVAGLGFLSASFFSFAERLKKEVRIYVLASLIAVAAGMANVQFRFLGIKSVKNRWTSSLQIQEEGKIFEKWSPVSRVAVFAPSTRSGNLKVTNDAAAESLLRKFDGNFTAFRKKKRLCRQAGQYLRPSGNVLIIGSAGGGDVLVSLGVGQEKITAVEINPVTADLVTGRFADYIGRIFQDPKVTLHVQDGRSFVAASKEKYDLIQLSMVDSWSGAAGGAYIFNENGLYTMEAVKDYFEHLKPDGILSITRYWAWNETLRLTNLFVEFQAEMGVENIPERIAIIGEKANRGRRATVLLKNGPLSREESRTLRNLAKECGGNIVYSVHSSKDEMQSGSRAGNIRNLILPKDQEDKRKLFLDSYSANLRPPTDNQPFFFFSTKLSRLFDFDLNMHSARRFAIHTLIFLFGACFTIAALVLFFSLKGKDSHRSGERDFDKGKALYFAMLGCGYMLIEISLMQRLTVFLGHPTWSLLLVLTGLLFSSALGSWLSSHFKTKPIRNLLAAPLTVFVLVIVHGVFAYDLLVSLMSLNEMSRIVVSAALVIPLGLPMGTCFPIGITVLTQNQPKQVSVAWGINGAFSVLGSVSAIFLAIFLGLKAALLTGGFCYAIAALVAWAVMNERRLKGRL